MYVCMDAHRKILMDLHDPYPLIINSKDFRKTLLSFCCSLSYNISSFFFFLMVVGGKGLGIKLEFREYALFYLIVPNDPIKRRV